MQGRHWEAKCLKVIHKTITNSGGVAEVFLEPSGKALGGDNQFKV
jgi:hypothetical protein